jgi:hypothetical protein
MLCDKTTVMLAMIFKLTKEQTSWGDYGDILVHGMTRHLGRKNGQLQLERTAPFVPQVFLPGIHDLIVTASAKDRLENVEGLEFRSVVKARIVRLDWHLWDMSRAEPPTYPNSGEPEDYILEREHETFLAEAIEHLWELVPAVVPAIQSTGGEFNIAAYSGEPFICADDFGGYGFITEELKLAINSLEYRWIGFQPASGG